MDKYIENHYECKDVPDYDSASYAIKQLKQLKGDLHQCVGQIQAKLDEIDSILCGLNYNHKWELHSFNRTTWPLREPPGAYNFRCNLCGEHIIIPADVIDQTEFVKLLPKEKRNAK